MSQPPPVLKRFETTVLKNKPGGGNNQVPAAATVNFYLQGATVKEGRDLDPGVATPVPVDDVGAIQEGDRVQVSHFATLTFEVVHVLDSATLELRNDTLVDPYWLEATVRLICITRRPVAFSDPAGSVAVGSSVVTDAVTGRAPSSTYLRDVRLDYIISGTGLSTRVYADSDAGGLSPSPAWVNARNFASLQAAVNALPASGGVVYLPAGRYQLSAGLVINKSNVTLLGAGNQAGTDVSTIIEPDDAHIDAFDLITVLRHSFKLRDVQLNGRSSPSGTHVHDCLVLKGMSASGNPVTNCYLENVSIQGAPRYGLYLVDIDVFLAANCEVLYSGSDGIRVEGSLEHGSRAVRLWATQSTANQGRGVSLDNVAGASLVNCGIEGNLGGVGVDLGQSVDARLAPGIQVLGCYFEDQEAEGASQAYQHIYLNNCPGAVVDSSMFFWHKNPPMRMAYLLNAQGMRFASNQHAITTVNPPSPVPIETLLLHDAPQAVLFGNTEVGQDIVPARVRITGSGVPTLSRNAATVIATDFVSLASAILALPASGGTVYLPEGVYDGNSSTKFVAPLILPMDKPVRLVGAGPGCTILRESPQAQSPVCLVQLAGSHQSLEHLSVEALASRTVPGDAVLVGRQAGIDQPGPADDARVVDCEIRDARGYAIRVTGSTESPARRGMVNGLVITDQGLSLPSSGGVFLGPSCDGWSLRAITSRLVYGTAHVFLDRVKGATVADSVFHSKGGNYHAACYVQGAKSVRISRCRLVSDLGDSNDPMLLFVGNTAVYGESAGIGCEQCVFERALAVDGEIRVLSGAVVKDLLLANVTFEKSGPDVGNEVKIDNGISEIRVLGGAVRLEAGTVPVRVDLGASGRCLRTTGVGVRLGLPGLTDTEIDALDDKRAGDMVFDRGTNKIKVWDPLAVPPVWKVLDSQAIP